MKLPLVKKERSASTQQEFKVEAKSNEPSDESTQCGSDKQEEVKKFYIQQPKKQERMRRTRSQIDNIKANSTFQNDVTVVKKGKDGCLGKDVGLGHHALPPSSKLRNVVNLCAPKQNNLMKKLSPRSPKVNLK